MQLGNNAHLVDAADVNADWMCFKKSTVINISYAWGVMQVTLMLEWKFVFKCKSRGMFYDLEHMSPLASLDEV